ncbi:unnamed protein product [Rhodiola kirilowii]
MMILWPSFQWSGRIYHSWDRSNSKLRLNFISNTALYGKVSVLINSKLLLIALVTFRKCST